MDRLAGGARTGKRVAANPDAPPPTIEGLWAVARYDLKMSDAEFFDLTPRQFAKLFDRHLEERKRFELVISMNTVATIASSFSPPETLPSYDRFMPSAFLPPPPEPTEEEVAMDLGAAFRGIMDLSQRAFPIERKRRNRKRA